MYQIYDKIVSVIFLAIVQGLTEWLPISSTGHLRLVEHVLGLEVPILFDVILHVGTLIVVLIFFRREVGKILSAIAHLDFKTEYGKMVPLIAVGAIPTVLIGLIFGRLIEDTFQSILPIAMAFIICGLIVYSSKIGEEKTDRIGYSTAIIIGIAQGISIIPGISRSGATIAIALLLGIKREKAFSFSFLLSIPAILGALSLTVHNGIGELITAGLGLSENLVGLIIAMLVGYFALKLLWKAMVKEKFHLFAFYCWIVGVIIVFSRFF